METTFHIVCLMVAASLILLVAFGLIVLSLENITIKIQIMPEEMADCDETEGSDGDTEPEEEEEVLIAKKPKPEEKPDAASKIPS